MTRAIVHHLRGLGRGLAALLLAGLAGLAAAPARAAPDLVVSAYQLLSTKRISLTVYEYSYRVSATNRGTAAADAQAQAASVRSWVTPVEAALFFGNVGPGQTVTSSDTLVIRHDRTRAFTAADIQWQFVASDATFSGRFEGAPGAAVSALLKNFVDSTPYARSAVERDADGRSVLRTDLVVGLAADATVGQIQPLLDSVNGRVIASLSGRSQIVVRMPDPGSLAGLELVRARLAAAPGIQSVDVSVFPVPLALPDNPRFRPPVAGGRPESAAMSQFLAHHLAIRAHAAWNTEARLNAPQTGSPMVSLPLLVMADYFGRGRPPRALGFSVLTSPSDFATSVADSDMHGYEVFGVIAASYGGDDSPAGLGTGVVPLGQRVISLRAVDLHAVAPDVWPYKVLQIVLAELDQQTQQGLPRAIVVNTSLSDEAGDFKRCNGGCDQATEAMKAATRQAALRWIRQVRGDNPGAISLESRFLHVTAAGNNPAAAARDATPYGLAGTEAGVVDTRGTVRTSDDVVLPGLGNTLVVEGRFAEATAIGVPPYVGCPNGNQLVESALGVFSPGGNISGIGAVDRGLILVNGNPAYLARGVYAPFTAAMQGAPQLPPATLNYDTYAMGSSLATPQVAGVALHAWALRPAMTPQQVKQLLIATAGRNQGGPGFADWGAEGPPPAPDVGCPGLPGGGQPGYHLTVDAYAAVMGADSPDGTLVIQRPTDAPARLALLDVARVENGQVVAGADGQFTQADIKLFLQEFEARRGQLDYSRYDLNGNGRTGETYVGTDIIDRRRVDLDGNLQWTTATQSIGGKAVPFDESFPADISVLVYYAFSPLYTGNEYERMLLLLPYLRAMNSPVVPFLSSATINVTGVQSTSLRFGQIEDQSDRFTSLCPGSSGERGSYSQVVMNAAATAYPNTAPAFWRPLAMAGRITELLPNAQNCSSFIATIGSSGQVWINAAARNLNAATGRDVEYQTRFYLGEPDWTAGPAGTLTPPARRLATQAMSYGVIDSPGASFRTQGSTRDFKLQEIGFQ